ncbi:hypothetical protein AB8O64_04850 [Streptomyces sp. QH1-20]|uniref:hypothetical protein n=1 Tax=Streptomyces sp. QH1-20 TaxID=3240934 RepID=UPI0035125388
MSEELLITARTVRGYLKELLGADEAERMNQLLNALLVRAAQGDDVDEELAAVFSADATLRAFASAVLTDAEHRPPRVREVRLSGDGEIVDIDRYQCPEGDVIWYRFDVGEEIPDCPTHGGRLSPAESGPA